LVLISTPQADNFLAMQIDKNPFFRKSFVPWYASETVCLIKAFLSLLCLLFGIGGIKVANHMENCHGCAGVPAAGWPEFCPPGVQPHPINQAIHRGKILYIDREQKK